MQKIVYVFDCPVHGERSEMFCLRAAGPKLLGRWKLGRWKRYEMTRVQLPLLYDRLALEEVKEIQEALLEGRMYRNATTE